MESQISSQLSSTVSRTDLNFLDEPYHGKVRDTYRYGDMLILITSDRISAFDHILKQTIPFKGQILNKLAAYFFDQTADIVKNHIIDIPDANVTIAHRCEPLQLEFVVRRYLAGHAWRTYQDGGRILCGKSLPDGLRQNSRLPEPILTPATKAAEGHDEDIGREEILSRKLMSESMFDELESIALKLFDRGSQNAESHGLILVDTKYEFGLDKDGEIVLIDEIHTPDSSRYFYADSYEELLKSDVPQRQLSKEFVREWLMANGFQGLNGQVLPDMPDEFRMEVARRYIELFERVTGSSFVPDTSGAPYERIERNIRDSLGI